jgi:hypothetical protein
MPPGQVGYASRTGWTCLQDRLVMPHGLVGHASRTGWLCLTDRLDMPQGLVNHVPQTGKLCITDRLFMARGQVGRPFRIGCSTLDRLVRNQGIVAQAARLVENIKDRKVLCQRQVCLVSLTSW